MISSTKNIQAIKHFFNILPTKIQTSVQQKNDIFYEDILNIDLSQQSLQKQNKTLVNEAKSFESFVIQIPKGLKKYDYKKNIKKNQQEHSISQNTKELTQSKVKSKKVNPRMGKHSKKIENVLKSSLSKQQDLTFDHSQNQEIFQSQIKVMKLKKIQLKNKLRKLNSQLQREKINCLSIQQSQLKLHNSQINPEDHLFERLKNSSFNSNKNSCLNFSRFKSKSDAQFSLPKNSLRQKQKVYSPQNHEAAFKLIEKMHNQKLKKQQKILDDMKKKQQKQLEDVKRLQEQKRKEKQQKKIRQKIYFNSPKSSNSSKSINFSLDKTSRQGSNEGHSYQKIDLYKESDRALIRQKIHKRVVTLRSYSSSKNEKELDKTLDQKVQKSKSFIYGSLKEKQMRLSTIQQNENV